MPGDDLATQFKQAALEEGFELVGVASAADAMLEPAIERYSQWLDRGFGASMEYLKRHQELKAHPEKLLPGWKSFLCVGLLYGAEPPKADGARAQVSLYARGRDYHEVIGDKLVRLAARIKHEHGADARPFVDSEPVLDRFWAWRAGMGWLGKNTCLIHRKLGSLVFIGGLLTTAELTPDEPQPDHCGRCRKCIDACPTAAITEDRFLDSAKCIAYHTIENKGVVPEQVMAGTGRWIAGCDICQTVCPWNDPMVLGAAFEISNPAYDAPLAELARWGVAEYKERMRGVAMGRVKYAAFLRNLAIATANSSLSSTEKHSVLEALSNHRDELAPGEGRDGFSAAIAWARGL